MENKEALGTIMSLECGRWISPESSALNISNRNLILRLVAVWFENSVKLVQKPFLLQW